MFNPDLKKMLGNVNSRYSLVVGTAKRAREIREEAVKNEVLLDDTLGVAEKLRAAGGKLRVSVYDGMFHVFQMAMKLIPESREAWDEAQRFLEIIYGIRREKEGRSVKVVRSGRGRAR